jgi:hypothetical protein
MKTPSNIRQKLPVVLVAGLGGFFTVVDVACAQPWATTTAPDLPWKALASSADGSRLVAAANTVAYFGGPPAPIFVSTNAGASWAQTSAPSNNWSSVACSADGIKLVAVATVFSVGNFSQGFGGGDGLIYTSPDLGTTWTRTSAPSNNWSAVASSADGARLVAVSAPQGGWVLNGTNYDYVFVGDGAVYSSLDSGATWTPTTAPSNYWTSVASSADGAKLVAAVAPCWDRDGFRAGDGPIYRSQDSGATWTRTSAPTNSWSAVASSADGTKLVAVAAPYYDGNNYLGEGAIYRSLDSGVTWTPTSAPSNRWSAVASSAEGTKLVATSTYDASDLIYVSTNSGATWTATRAPRESWTAVASSADGYRVVAAGLGKPICTMPYSGPWRWADAPTKDWGSVASSADGTKLVAVADQIYTSANSGATWTATTAPSNNWSTVASSADATKLVAVADQIYTSGNSGATWTPTTAPSNRWSSVASSADGTKLVAVAAPQAVWNGTNYDYIGDGAIYSSLDSGATWSRTSAPSDFWYSAACSADGTKVVAAAYQMIYTSSNSGATWTHTSAPTNYWRSVASSGDGTKLVAVADQIYTSGNSGATWTPTTAPTKYWNSVASSADGTKLVVVCYDWQDTESIYISTNSGAAWTPAGEPAMGYGHGGWKAIAASADGSNIVAVGDRAICTLRSPAPAPPLPPSPQMAVAWSGATLGLSWLVPSTRFVLQQNSDLSSTNWAEVPTPPTLDCTNLHQRLTLTPSLGSSYFRLKQQ